MCECNVLSWAATSYCLVACSLARLLRFRRYRLVFSLFRFFFVFENSCDTHLKLFFFRWNEPLKLQHFLLYICVSVIFHNTIYIYSSIFCWWFKRTIFSNGILFIQHIELSCCFFFSKCRLRNIKMIIYCCGRHYESSDSFF